MAMILADLHIHSPHSRATARAMSPEGLASAARQKGLDLLGSGDFVHPAWLAELREKLTETGDGAYELKPEWEAASREGLPPACQRPVRFLLSGEISSIYKRHGQTRKVHSLILLPDFAAVERLAARLARLGNIKSDGRPILGLDARDLLEVCLEADPGVIFIPAHIWTPWFSLFGSKSGFDRLEDCFDDLTPHIHALETGLSSDPAMNWRVSALDPYVLVSNSDAHSPGKLGREANLLACPPTYQGLARALSLGAEGGFAGTLEFFPDEGKYHLDGHRKCGVRLNPEETRRLGGKCPVCGGPLTVGVLSRVEDLADRPAGSRPPGAPPFESLVPLDEVVGEVLDQGPNTKKVRALVAELLARLGPELSILRHTPLEDLERLAGPLLAEAVGRVRRGEVWTEGGYDGEFGVVKVFRPGERQRLAGQGRFWNLAPTAARGRPARGKSRPPQAAPPPAASSPPPPPLLSVLDPALEGLNPQQRAAVEHRGRHLLVRAGPGAGKTRLLVGRAVALLEEGLDPGHLALITFTRKAAGELAERLAALRPGGAGVKVATFHALGREILTQALGREPRLLAQEERQALVTRLAKEADVSPGVLDLALTRAKQRLAPDLPPELSPLWDAYQAALASEDALDLDDLVRAAVLALRDRPGLAETWRQRFRHLLVDEYQDVNPVQVALLQALAGEGATVAAIGDPDQAIYGFRGADRALFDRFASDFPGAETLGLTLNYRNPAPLLALAQGLMAAEPDRGRRVLAAVRRQGEPAVTAVLAGPRQEASWVARTIVELLGGLDSRQVEAGHGPNRGYGASEIAVLYRLHAQAPPLAEALAQAGVPFQTASREPLAETDPLDFRAQRVSLLTLHAAKGLEFPVVFLVGLEEHLLPYRPPGREPAELGEERRLVYVGLTRARERLFLSRARQRTLFGQTKRPEASPFWNELPRDQLTAAPDTATAPRARQLALF
ncbi:MAG: UvrD-helicase domain-containing protein [Deltaproteobacteria bacterium]|nr:UvrD-helicase domain-containing protein [Deltaproteobacteria bacterium]